MKIAFLLAGLLFVLNVWAGDVAPVRLTFDKGKVGELPPGWKSGVTGQGASESTWKLVQDKTAPGGPLVLFQTSKNPRATFNVCLAQAGGKHKDIDISIALKAIAGEADQGGGILWRARDKDNFYIVRFNPLEQNFWLYKTVAGKRMSLVKVDAKGEAGKWHTIRVVPTPRPTFPISGSPPRRNDRFLHFATTKQGDSHERHAKDWHGPRSCGPGFRDDLVTRRRSRQQAGCR